MGVTVDLIPRLPDESPEEAIARIYAGAVSFRIDSETLEAEVGRLPEEVAPAPPGAFADWRAEVLRRLHELFPHWEVETYDDELCTLWADGYLWRIEMNEDDITLRARRHVDLQAPAASDAEVLAAFEGLHTIVHWPHDHGSYADLDDPADHPESFDRIA